MKKEELKQEIAPEIQQQPELSIEQIEVVHVESPKKEDMNLKA